MTIAVFLADDHAIVREGLALLLNAEPDIEVVGQAGDAEGAIDGVARLQPDVAVLDIEMPGLGGLAATRCIRTAYPRTQVVILSVHDTREHIRHALRAGARGYVLKECVGAELIKAVRAVHAGDAYTSPKAQDKVLKGLAGTGDDGPPDDPLACLSDRERQIFYVVVEGKTSAEIGEILLLSPKTIETHRSRMYKKLEVHNLAELMVFAAKNRLLPLD
jgi:DNA-binding NarL/FixJ family response regulator